jgi:hypothetical protein
MVITTDHNAITKALEQFNIKPEDYYLMFDSDANAIYIVWCTTWSNALHLVQSESCIDMDPANSQEWQSYEELQSYGESPSLHCLIPTPLVCVRYILEVN